MIKKHLTLKKGLKLLYFSQPEKEPIILIVAKQKKSGLDIVKCRENCKNKIREYSLEKLEIMIKGLDNYKMEASPENEKKTKEIKFEYKYLDFIIEFTFLFDFLNNEHSGIDIFSETFTFYKIVLILDLKVTEIKIDVTKLFIELFTQEHLLESFDNLIFNEVKKHFPNGNFI